MFHSSRVGESRKALNRVGKLQIVKSKRMKRIKFAAALLAVVLVVGSAFTSNMTAQDYGFRSVSSPDPNNVIVLELVDLSINPGICASASSTDHCKANLDLAAAGVDETAPDGDGFFEATVDLDVYNSIQYKQQNFEWQP